MNYFHHPRLKANDNNSQHVPSKCHSMVRLEDLETWTCDCIWFMINIYKGNNVCLSVCVGSAWKILLVTAHTNRQTDIVQGWPPVLPPLYGQVWSVFSIWTGNRRPTNTVQGWPPVLPPLYGQGTGDQQGGG